MAGAGRRSTTSCASRRIFPARSHPLERNYRSTPQILAAASGLIANNEGRLGKTLTTDLEDGDTVIVRGHWDGDEEARAIGEDIERLQREGRALNGMAILVRASFQMRAFEDRFITLGLPYRVIGGPRFYERQEIRDALAYLKVTVAPDNDLAFERIINTPKRGIGDTSVKDACLARREGLALYRAAQAMSRDRRAAGQGAARACATSWSFRPLAADVPACRTPSLPRSSSTSRATPTCGRPTRARRAGPAGEPEGTRALHGRLREPGGFLEHIALVMDVDSRNPTTRSRS
jgi:DNA helicase II / ATP-dependent DNA helicase PcrA